MNLTRLLVGALLSAIIAIPAQATKPRTWVASYGNDANTALNCSRVAPCRTFQAAVGVTDIAGEVVVLDSAGYGTVMITQSVSIIAPAGVYAGITVPLMVGAGVLVNVGAGGTVVLRGLAINSTGGMLAIATFTAGQLIVEDCAISNIPVGIMASGPAVVHVSGTVIRDVGFGIDAGYGATVSIVNSQLLNVSNKGLSVEGGPSGVTTNVFITDTLVTGDGSTNTWCIDNVASPATIGNIYATRVSVSRCYAAITNEPLGWGATSVSDSTVTGNSYGFRRESGTFYSLGNNHVVGNTYDTFGVITLLPPR
jgi:hypothetical protein